MSIRDMLLNSHKNLFRFLPTFHSIFLLGFFRLAFANMSSGVVGASREGGVEATPMAETNAGFEPSMLK